MNSIKRNDLPSLIGKTIKWKAPAYHANAPYEGIAKINNVLLGFRNPIVADIIEGDNINHAFIGDGDNLAFSDSDRLIIFKIT
jgi:hypothetical protein